MTVRVFYTAHPAALLRDPSWLPAIKAHLSLVDRAVTGLETERLVLPEAIKRAVPVPDYPVTLLSLDIETYGKLATMPAQRYFHPLKSEAYDHVSPLDMIRTCGLSWRNPRGELLHTVLLMQHAADRALLERWLRHVSQHGGALLGQNIQFDVQYLRHCYPSIKRTLNPDRLPLIELMVMNYLHNESRPERSLKDLAPLFGITTYDEEDKGGGSRYAADDDPGLWRYNCQDTGATLLLYEHLTSLIRGDYPDSPKLSEYTKRWYSNLTWLSISLGEWGLAVDEERLGMLSQRFHRRLHKLCTMALSKWGMVLKGEGSDRSKREAIDEAIAALSGPPLSDLVLTEKRKEVSINEENCNKLLARLPRTCDPAKKLRVMRAYAVNAKIMDSYFTPLLVGGGVKRNKMDQRPIGGLVYPRWSIVPSAYDDGGEGGTKQARITPKQPAIQTWPAVIKSCMTSRYRENGYLLWADLSRIELKVAALLSGDPEFMRDQLPGTDMHEKTAQLIFGDGIVKHPSFEVIYRQVGKTLNFLVLYRGGAFKFRETVMAEVGIDLPLDFCEQAIKLFDAKYPRLRAWQEELIATAGKTGYVMLPLLGQSRLFLGGRVGAKMAEKEIANIPVQAIAANILIAAQVEIANECRRHHLLTCPFGNIYDAVGLDGPWYERETGKLLVARCLPNPQYYKDLCDFLGRSLPLEYKIKVA